MIVVVVHLVVGTSISGRNPAVLLCDVHGWCSVAHRFLAPSSLCFVPHSFSSRRVRPYVNRWETDEPERGLNRHAEGLESLPWRISINDARPLALWHANVRHSQKAFASIIPRTPRKPYHGYTTFSHVKRIIFTPLRIKRVWILRFIATIQSRVIRSNVTSKSTHLTFRFFTSFFSFLTFCTLSPNSFHPRPRSIFEASRTRKTNTDLRMNSG